MLPLSDNIRVFLSSTFLDLHDIRKEIAHGLREVFGAQLIIMETFGSDDVPPDITAVRRVRECDVFVGIYARRYGTVDRASCKSVTELELDEAERAFSAGALIGILLYVLEETAPWPPERIEDTPTAKVGLQRLRERAYRYMVTQFSREKELIIFVIRDILQKLRERSGGASLAIRRQLLPREQILQRPAGMEFLASAGRRYLAGRSSAVKEVLRCLSGSPLVLLLGDSGVGKTSLIHAGLFPRLVENGWRVVYTRPFGLPWHDVVIQLQSSIFEGRPNYRGPLLPILGEILGVIEERRLVLVIDQFEDILTAREPGQVEKLIADLMGVHQIADEAIRVLISYRADLEARLGRYWQGISGASQGLPRIYLSGISAEDALGGAERSLRDLGVELRLTPEDEARLRNDFFTTSKTAGHPDVYPPYVQMFVDHVWRHVQNTATPYAVKDYHNSGGMEGIVGGYLEQLLGYAQDGTGHFKMILVALVRSYGMKAQRSLQELAGETGLTAAQCEEALERLIDLRLIRPIDSSYEVAHDFLAQQIINKLVDAEERAFKRFRELLATKAGAYSTTGARLTAKELLMLFRYRDRTLPTEAELRLLLVSWIYEEGPALFWLLTVPPASFLDWVRSAENSAELTRSQQAFVALLRRRIGGPLSEKDYFSFREYQLSAELAALISADPLGVPEPVLIRCLSSERPEVRASALEAVIQRVNAGEWDWITNLRKSASSALQWVYERLVLDPKVSFPPIHPGMAPNRALTEFKLLKQLARSRETAEVRANLKEIQTLRPKKRSWLFAQGLAFVKSNRIERLLKQSQRTAAKKADVLLGAIDGVLPLDQFTELLREYRKRNAIEASRDSETVKTKADGVAQAILRTSSLRDIGALRKTFAEISLTPSAQAIALVLLRDGGLEDFLLILGRVATYPERIDHWYHTEVARAVACRMEEIATEIPACLLDLPARREFWEFLSDRERTLSPRDALPLRNRDNRSLYVRLAAYGMIGAAQKSDRGLLCQLACHPYRLIARAAAIRLVRIAGEEGISILVSRASEVLESGDAQALAGALRDAEVEHYGLAQLW